MWGANKGGQDDGDSTTRNETASIDASRSARSVRSAPRSHYDTRQEPTERTRLLDDHRRPPNSDGYLDPDDPAVGLRPIPNYLVAHGVVGLPIQPLVRPLSPLLYHPLLHDFMLVVDTALNIYLYFASRHALARQRLFRLRIYLPHNWEPSCCYHLFRRSR